MKVKISDNCIGCGCCMNICAEVFKVEDEQKAQVIGEVTENNLDAVEDAIGTCPVGAIYTEE